MHSKASLLTLGCTEGRYSIYCTAKQGLWAANSQKTQTSLWLNDRLRERVVWYLISARILFSLVGAEGIGFWFQPAWSLCACGQSAANVFHLVGVSVSAKQPKDMAQNIIYSSYGGTSLTLFNG